MEHELPEPNTAQGKECERALAWFTKMYIEPSRRWSLWTVYKTYRYDKDGQSAIQAVYPIKKGETLTGLVGYSLSVPVEEEKLRRSLDFTAAESGLTKSGPRFLIGVARYINHRCRAPNAELHPLDKTRFIAKAIEDIEANHEVTIQYSKDFSEQGCCCEDCAPFSDDAYYNNPDGSLEAPTIRRFIEPPIPNRSTYPRKRRRLMQQIVQVSDSSGDVAHTLDHDTACSSPRTTRARPRRSINTCNIAQARVEARKTSDQVVQSRPRRGWVGWALVSDDEGGYYSDGTPLEKRDIKHTTCHSNASKVSQTLKSLCKTSSSASERQSLVVRLKVKLPRDLDRRWSGQTLRLESRSSTSPGTLSEGSENIVTGELLTARKRVLSIQPPLAFCQERNHVDRLPHKNIKNTVAKGSCKQTSNRVTKLQNKLSNSLNEQQNDRGFDEGHSSDHATTHSQKTNSSEQSKSEKPLQLPSQCPKEASEVQIFDLCNTPYHQYYSNMS